MLDLTGGWPLLLERYAQSDETTWEKKASELEDYVVVHHDDLLKAVGLGAPDAQQELQPLLFPNQPLRLEDVDTCADLWGAGRWTSS